MLALLAAALAVGTQRRDAASEPASEAPQRSGAMAMARAFAQPRKARAAIEIARGTLRLEGQAVADGDGHPIAGARITLGGARVTTTEADGSFAFDELAEGSYALIAEQGALYGEELDARLDDASDPVTLKLKSGPTVVVHVVEADGRPIAGAKVETSSRSATTSDDGIAMLRSCDLSSEVVRVSAAGHARFRDRFDSGDDPAVTIERTIVLMPGAELSGLVVDEAGKPVPSAYVELAQAAGRGDSARTEDDGTWKVAELAAGSYTVRASSNLHVATADLAVEVDGVHARRDVIVRVAAGAQISGVVVDGSGAPLGDATVSVGNRSETTDASGHFVVAGLEPASYDVAATTARLGVASRSVEVARQAHVELRLVLEASSLAGIVVDERGTPIEDASVTAKSSDPHGFTFARTDEHGRFDLAGLPPGDYEVVAEHDTYTGASKVTPIHVRPDNRNLRLVLPSLATLKGRVVFEGRPVPYFGFAIVDDVTSLTFETPTSVRDPDGRFAVRELGPGARNLVIVGPGFQRRVLERLQLAPGATLDLGDIVVDQGAAIHGHVIDELGAPVGGAVVELHRGWHSSSGLAGLMGDSFSATSDASGAYRIAGLTRDDSIARISATHPVRGVSLTREVAADETEVDLTIVATGSIDGLVANWNATDDGHAMATLDGDWSTTSFSSMVDIAGSGAFHFTNLPPGDYEVRLLGRHSVPPAHVTVAANATAHAALAVGRIAVQLTIRARCESIALAVAGTIFNGEKCRDGAATFTDVAPGNYEACVNATTCVPIVVPEQPEVTLEL